MADHRLYENKISSTSVFKGKLLNVFSDDVELTDGTEAVREYIHHPGAAVIVPLHDDSRITLVRQFRYPLGQVMIELPAGKLDEGESAEDTAHRELLEEVGYIAEELIRLGRMHPGIGYSDEQIDVFLARGLQTRANSLDEGEQLEPFIMPLDEAVSWIQEDRITDVKTVIALYWTDLYLKGNWALPDK